MASAHTTLRELVAHLGRAQRAFDAARYDEAELAIADALDIDPHNVQAMDLRQRIARARPVPDVTRPIPRRKPEQPRRRTARGPGAGVVDHDAPAVPPWPPTAPTTASSPAHAPRISPGAWSSFEQRVRARRADLAVAEAQTALARGDRERAEAALAELDAVASGDPRCDALAARLEKPSPVASDALPRYARPAGEANENVAPAAEVPLVAKAGPVPDLPAAIAAPPLPRRRRSLVTFGGALAATAALGFWVVATRPPGSDLDLHPSQAATQPEASAGTTGVASSARGAGAAETGGVEPQVLPLGDLPGSPSPGAPAEPAGSAKAVPPAGDVSSVAPQSEAAPRLQPERPGYDATRPIELARAEPPATPLDPPVQSPIAPPAAPRFSGMPGETAATQSVAPIPGMPSPPPAAPAPAPSATGDPAAAPASTLDASAVRGVLDGYADAFSSLDADATQRVWPGVDLRALRRAFEQLSAQSITFSRCNVDANGEVAEAVCVGRATWVPRVGDRSPRAEPRTWRFALGRDGDQWVIDRVQVQR